jgi:hypothetical protein
MFRDNGSVSQFSFGRDYALSDRFVVSERLREGMTACGVLEDIAALYPGITAFNLVFYDAQLNSTDGDFIENRSVWIPRDYVKRDILKQISDVNYKESNSVRMMAVSSQVMLEARTFAHILMLDFASDGVLARPSDADEDYVLPGDATKFVSMPGAILDSGASHHYWGETLLTRSDWETTLQTFELMEIKRMKNGLPLYDKGFLHASLKRGYSALRLFAYPGTGKPKEPSVVALIK